jgi:hypothetical protein
MHRGVVDNLDFPAGPYAGWFRYPPHRSESTAVAAAKERLHDDSLVGAVIAERSERCRDR